jgi:hypothetical protein
VLLDNFTNCITSFNVISSSIFSTLSSLMSNKEYKRLILNNQEEKITISPLTSKCEQRIIKIN